MDDIEQLERLYAQAGGVAGIPDRLRDYLPRGKADLARATEVARLGLPELAPVLPHLLMWLRMETGR